MTYLGRTVWLTALWLGLWRSTTPATLITGVALAVALTWFVRRSDVHRERHRVHLHHLARYFAHMLVALVRSNVQLAIEVLTPADRTRPGILEVRLPPSSEVVLTVIANSITLTPGTITLEVDPDTSTLQIHVLHLRDVEAARAEVEHLHRLATAAFVHVDTTRRETIAP